VDKAAGVVAAAAVKQVKADVQAKFNPFSEGESASKPAPLSPRKPSSGSGSRPGSSDPGNPFASTSSAQAPIETANPFANPFTGVVPPAAAGDGGSEGNPFIK
jgi:hypothetical protein